MDIKFIQSFMDKKSKVYLLLLLSLIIIGSILSVWPILLIQKIVDRAVFGQIENVKPIIIYGSFYLSIQVVRSIVIALVNFLSKYIQVSIGFLLQTKVYKNLLKAELININVNNSIDITNTLIEDTNFVINNIMEPFTQFCLSLTTFIFGLYFMVSINWVLTLLILPLGLITSLTVKLITEKANNNIEKQRDMSAELWKVFNEGIRGIMPIRLHRYGRSYETKIIESSQRLKKVSIIQAKLESLSYGVASALFMITIGGILTISGVFVIKGLITVGGLTAIMMYNHMLVDPLIEILEINQQLIKLKVSLKRIKKLINLPVSYSNEKSIESVDTIELNNISFQYDELSILSDLSLKLKGDCKIAVVGETGSGKSTLVNIVSGLYQPTQGTIAYYKDGERKDCLPNISYMIQDGYIFDASLAENLKISNKDIRDNEIDYLVDLCLLKDVVNIHKDENLGENGAKLSGGEKKRVRLARTLANSDADIFIFDELSSSLDAIIATELYEKVIETLKHKMCIFIEHDIKIASKMDYIIVIENGRLAQFGTHNDLVLKDGKYLDLYKSII